MWAVPEFNQTERSDGPQTKAPHNGWLFIAGEYLGETRPIGVIGKCARWYI